MNEVAGEDAAPDVLRLCKALDLCGALFGLWFAAAAVTLLLLTTPWQVIPWLAMTLLGTLVIRFIGDTISAELAHLHPRSVPGASGSDTGVGERRVYGSLGRRLALGVVWPIAVPLYVAKAIVRDEW